ncbi:hypothetical protein EVAR_39545_1 [Eumeta japonica]|uniref:Uncharacterized protein n=1 Tax=Eumeta variegata TaxID=151549 RepID=A0A4C1XL62_EUMVA|nr:hypothetical protein EVAR_39545_1 [Eumeta japonica]
MEKQLKFKLNLTYRSENRPRPIPPISTLRSPGAAVPFYPAHWAALGRLTAAGTTRTGRTLRALGTGTIALTSTRLNTAKLIAEKIAFATENTSARVGGRQRSPGQSHHLPWPLQHLGHMGRIAEAPRDTD